MATVRTCVLMRIANFELLLEQSPTPLLQEELRDAIKLHRNALESEDIGSFIPDLNAVHAKIDEHWKSIYADMLITASLLSGMRLFERFLLSKLLEDYANKPYTVSGPALSLAELIAKQHHRDPREDNTTLDDTYQFHVISPLKEYKLDKDSVENKLIAVAAREGRPGNDIQPLIGTCDWAKLAAVLSSDRDIMIKLTQRSAYLVEVSKIILAGISRVQNKYFTCLTSPSTFTLAPTRDQTSLFPKLFTWARLGSGGGSSGPKVENSSDDRQFLLGEDLPLPSFLVNLKKIE